MNTDTTDLVEELATFLYARDWPSEQPPNRGNVHHRYEFRCIAAAIVNGEAWAIRRAWPEAAYDIKTRSDWSMAPEAIGAQP